MILPDDIVETGVTLKDQYFDLRGLCAYSSLSVPALRNYIKIGLPSYRLQGKILVKRSEFDAWIQKYKINRSRDIQALADDALSGLSSKSFGTDKA